jgi:signal transduction histidine kinase
MVCSQEVTELQRLKLQHEQLVGQVLEAQDDERRRIARVLHDSDFAV